MQKKLISYGWVFFLLSFIDFFFFTVDRNGALTIRVDGQNI